MISRRRAAKITKIMATNGNNEDGAKAVAKLLVCVFMGIVVDAIKESRSFLEEEFVEA